MEPRVSFITLGVSDLQRATRFYAERQMPGLSTLLRGAFPNV